jgi:hypothetical protein
MSARHIVVCNGDDEPIFWGVSALTAEPPKRPASGIFPLSRSPPVDDEEGADLGPTNCKSREEVRP